jgi:ABC-type uncharacterized transport system ATPase component
LPVEVYPNSERERVVLVVIETETVVQKKESVSSSPIAMEHLLPDVVDVLVLGAEDEVSLIIFMIVPCKVLFIVLLLR